MPRVGANHPTTSAAQASFWKHFCCINDAGPLFWVLLGLLSLFRFYTLFVFKRGFCDTDASCKICDRSLLDCRTRTWMHRFSHWFAVLSSLKIFWDAEIYNGGCLLLEECLLDFCIYCYVDHWQWQFVIDIVPQMIMFCLPQAVHIARHL